MNIHCLFLSQTSHHKKHHFRNIAMTVCLHTSNIFHFLIVQFDFQARQKKKIQSFSLHRNKRLSKHIYLSIITGVLISPAFNFLGSFGSAAKVFQIDRIITRIAAWTTNLPLFILWNPPVSDFAWALINFCNFRKRCSPFFHSIEGQQIFLAYHKLGQVLRTEYCCHVICFYEGFRT